MDRRQQDNFRSLLTEAIIKLCQLEAVYINELRIEGTVCVASDCASVMIAHFTECVGNTQSLDTEINDNSEFVFDQNDNESLSVDHTELMLPEVKVEHVLPDEIIRTFEEVGYNETLSLMHGLCQEATLNANDSTAVDVKKSSGGQYQCPNCHKMCKLKRTLQRHLKKHCEGQQHRCHHCSATFTSEATLHVHITAEHGNWCDSQLGGQELAEKSSTHYHQGHHHRDVLKTEQVDSIEHDGCQAANVHVLDAGEITHKHMLLEAVGMEQLNQTDHADQKMQELSESHTPATPETRSKYWNARKTSTIMQYFEKVHVETPQGRYLFKCCLCHKMFKIRTSLYEHINSHIGKRRYACNQCGDRFVHHSSLHNHVNNKHVITSQQQITLRYLCTGCDRRFKFRSQFERHLRSNPDHSTTKSP